MSGIMVAPSFLGIKGYEALRYFLNRIKKYGADRLHIDFGDGEFIAEKSGQELLWQMHLFIQLPQELHLMVHQPLKFLGLIQRHVKEVGRENIWVIIHPEAAGYDECLFDLINFYGFSCGLALRPQTPLEAISVGLFAKLDLIVVMTVEPGASGQPMLKEHLAKVSALVNLRNQHSCHFEIEVDGGVKAETAQDAVNAGADILVSGGFIQADPSRIKWLKSLKRDS